MTLDSFFAWLQTTTVGETIGQSTFLTGFLSATHLLGLTLVCGGALVSGLRLLGVLLKDRPLSEVAGTAARGITIGLPLSVVTGAMLFTSRASTIAESGTFQLKMALLAMGILFHFIAYRPLSRSDQAPILRLRLIGALGLALWFAVASAGAWFILFE